MTVLGKSEKARWALNTLPLAPLAALLYLLFEWIFFITKPSALAGQPFSTELAVLLRSPLTILLPLVGIQATASAISACAYPRLRSLALLPGATLGGIILLVLVDNFTYTLFGFGVLTVSPPFRLVYASLLPMVMTFVGWTVNGWVVRSTDRPTISLIALAVTVTFTLAPVFEVRTAAVSPDVNAPPASHLGTGALSNRPNILLLGLDGLDASMTSAYGYARPTTPFLEIIRDQSLFFENAFANVGRTHGSLVSLLTGRLPFSTHVTFPPTVLVGEDAHRHLPGLLKKLGYTTLQLGMRHYADAEDANLLGFDAANYRWQDPEPRAESGPSNEVQAFRLAVVERLDERLGQLFGVRHAIDGYAHIEGRQASPYWRDERRVSTLVRYFSRASEPWFVHVHLLDTHCCAFEPASRRFTNGPNTADDTRDNQVRESDDNVRRLFRALETRGELERTMIVIYSDHTSHWTTKGRVPLMIRFPQARPQGRVTANVQLADVAPTILEYLGVQVPAWMDGESVLHGDERLASNRLIFGLSDVSERQPVASFLTVLTKAGPPNYGATSATMIAGHEWFELSLLDGALTTGEIAGHTGQRPAKMSQTAARSALSSKLDHAQFRIEAAPSP